MNKLSVDQRLNLIGKKFGRLTVSDVIRKEAARPNRFTYMLQCVCTCGKLVLLKPSKVIGGYSTLSCGCLRKEKWRKAYYAWVKDQERLNI
jgi:hypothetical protein